MHSTNQINKKTLKERTEPQNYTLIVKRNLSARITPTPAKYRECMTINSRKSPNFKCDFNRNNDRSPRIFLKSNYRTRFPCKNNDNTDPCLPAIDQKMVCQALVFNKLYRRFHGRGRHLGSGANAAKFTVNVWEKS